MKIIVAVKQVPERDSPARIAGTWIEETDLQFTMNELDAYALEEALRLKDKHGCEVVVVSVGPDRVGMTLHEALAKGADRAIHVVCHDLASRDWLGVARLYGCRRARIARSCLHRITVRGSWAGSNSG